MNQTEEHLQSLSICHKLFFFIVKALAAQARKPVTLGHPVVQTKRGPNQLMGNSELGYEAACSAKRVEGSESSSSGFTSAISDELAHDIEIEDDASSKLKTKARNGSDPDQEMLRSLVGEAQARARALKKTVSIKDEPELINASKKRKKMKVESRVSSMAKEVGEERKPLRSILKVGSNLNEKSASNVVNYSREGKKV